jgi:hypothetical protein
MFDKETNRRSPWEPSLNIQARIFWVILVLAAVAIGFFTEDWSPILLAFLGANSYFAYKDYN